MAYRGDIDFAHTVLQGGCFHIAPIDDGFPVPTASFKVGGRTYRANAAGKAKVPAGSGKAAAPGYAGASFRAP